jgi:exodeoxyribonuclease-5
VTCAGCGHRIVETDETLELADGARVHFRDCDCLFQYADRRRKTARDVFWQSVDPAKCGGCGAAILTTDRVYDYYDPKSGPEIVARCHADNLACLIAWNERWHAAEGHEYDAQLYRRRLDEIPKNQCTKDRIVMLTDEQRAAVAAIEDAIGNRETFALHGLAGTGKTTVAAHIATSRPGAYLCAPTGKAASVLRDKTGIKAATVHSAFYQYVREEEREGEPPKLVFRPAHLPGSLKGQVLLLDECSMIDRKTAADILATGITVIAIGDPGQLPPINGDPFFTRASFTLEQIHRQALESPIIRQAHAVRSTGRYEPDGDAVRVVDRLAADDLRTANVVLAGRRATRSRMNTLCRRALGISSPLPLLGEPLVCLRNAPKFGLYNGAIYYASRDLCEGDKTIGISTDAGDIEMHAHLLPPGREDEPLDLPPGGWMTAFAFGYSLTVHKAQGSEWDNVLLIDEGDTFQEEAIRWRYTAITRARERVIVARK